MDRVTLKQLRSLVTGLNHCLRRPIEYAPGHLYLDKHCPGDGRCRYRVEEVSSGGGISQPFGARNRSRQAMFDHLHTILDTLNLPEVRKP